MLLITHELIQGNNDVQCVFIQDVAPVGASWESSSEDEMPLSKRRLAA